MDTSILEVRPPCDSVPNLPVPAYAQRLSEDDVRKDEGYPGVTTPVEYPSPLRKQHCCEPVPQCSGGRGVPARRLHIQTAPTTLPYRIVQDSPIYVRPVIVVTEVSIDFLKKQVQPGGDEVGQVCGQILVLPSSSGDLLPPTPLLSPTSITSLPLPSLLPLPYRPPYLSTPPTHR